MPRGLRGLRPPTKCVAVTRDTDQSALEDARLPERRVALELRSLPGNVGRSCQVYRARTTEHWH